LGLLKRGFSGGRNCTAFLRFFQKSIFQRICKKNGTKRNIWNKPQKIGTNGTNLEQLLEHYKLLNISNI